MPPKKLHTSPPLSTSPNFWGKPPPLQKGKPPPLQKGKGKGKGKEVQIAQEPRSLVVQLEENGVGPILRNLIYWQTLASSLSISEITHRITTAPWFELLLIRCAEQVAFLTGAPNSGKSTLATRVAKVLGLTKTRTSSKNFWIYTRPTRPYFTLWIYCNDSFYDQESFNWSKMKQSLQSVLAGEEFQIGAVICEGHRILDFPEYDNLATTTSILASNAQTLQLRGTCPTSIRRHKLHMSNKLDFIESMNNVGIFPSDLPTVALVCMFLQQILLDDMGQDTTHLRQVELDGRWMF